MGGWDSVLFAISIQTGYIFAYCAISKHATNSLIRSSVTRRNIISMDASISVQPMDWFYSFVMEPLERVKRVYTRMNLIRLIVIMNRIWWRNRQRNSLFWMFLSFSHCLRWSCIMEFWITWSWWVKYDCLIL